MGVGAGLCMHDANCCSSLAFTKFVMVALWNRTDHIFALWFLLLSFFFSRLLIKAFSVFVRPILEFSSVVWSPHFRCDIENNRKCSEALH